MDEFWQDLISGDIQFRDKWQFELKSEFFPRSPNEASIYTQEFYIFIPNALQINAETYSKEEFYRNQTNLIRYKTPEFTLAELTDPNNYRSPINRIKKAEGDKDIAMVEDELKLLGNIFRSALRSEVLNILSSHEHKNAKIESLCQGIWHFRELFWKFKEQFFKQFSNQEVRACFQYTDEFLSSTIDYYLTGLLDEERNRNLDKNLDEKICALIIEEKNQSEPEKMTESKETILYRKGLLNKFVIDALLLHTNRASIQQKYGHYIGAISAGIAMLLYLLLFIWQGEVFLINSQPFIIVTVIAYVLKDRIKETLKTISYQRAFRWFSDYTTEIESSDEEKTLGEFRESFTFVDEGALPKEVLSIRNREFNKVLQTVKRPEQVMYIKKTVKMFPQAVIERRRALNIIFRFNIQDFLTKASDPYHNYIALNPDNKALVRTRLPKVYHVNIILKNSFLDAKAKVVSEFKKFRIVLNKNGIIHIEQV